MIKFVIMYTWVFVTCNAWIVETNSGPISGTLIEDKFAKYFAYQGIPYAEPPVGNLRFLPPQPKEPWTETLQATSEGPVCPQPEGIYKYHQMSEDCLYLNVYVPFKFVQTNESLLPILFFIHGGEFQSLSGNADYIYGPQLILDYNIIFVSANYRLGALGFLSLGTPDASGNVGIKDIILALQWVKANINKFGGDPNKITIGGNSAGAALAHYLTLTEKTKNLFKQAILLSGSATGYRFLARHPVNNALNLAKELNLDISNITNLLKELKNVNVHNIIKAQISMGKNNNRNAVRPYAPFVPCKEINSPHAILSKDPIEIIKSGLNQKVPVLAGFNAQEGIKMLPAISKSPDIVDFINENFELSIPSDIEYPYGSHKSIQLASEIKRFYFNNENITNNNIDKFVEFLTDTQFFYSINSWIEYHKKYNNGAIVYYYQFDFDGDLNWFKLKNDLSYPGTSHADELGYIFLTEITKPLLTEANKESKRVFSNLLQYCTNFVKNGNPNTFDKNQTTWCDTDAYLRHLNLNDRPVMIQHCPRDEYYKFWKTVYENYNYYVKNGGETQNKIIP